MGEGKAHPSCKRGIKPRIYYTRRIGLPEPSIEVILTCGTTCGWAEAIITSMLFYFDPPTITLAQMLEKLIASYPRVRPYLLDTSGLLQTSIRVLINKERPEPDATLETSLHDEDQVTLLVVVAGGDLYRFVAPRHMEANCSFQTTINHK